jgi:hypothetical protein
MTRLYLRGDVRGEALGSTHYVDKDSKISLRIINGVAEESGL